MINLYLFALALAGSIVTTHADPLTKEDRRAIEALKQTNVSEIEAALPERAFAKWLSETAGSGVEFLWRPGDCAIAPVGKVRRDDRPRCVRIDVLGPARPGPWLSLQIQIQVEKGDKPLRPPRVIQILKFNRDGTIETPDTLGEVLGATGSSK